MPSRRLTVACDSPSRPVRETQHSETRSSELAWIKGHRAWLSENHSFCEKLVNDLKVSGAFNALRDAQLSSDALECKIAEVIGPNLHEFMNETEIDARMAKLEQERQVFEEAARSLARVAALRNDGEAERRAQIEMLKAEMTSETLAKNKDLVRQLKQPRTNVRHAQWLDRIRVDVTIVIRSATGARWNRIFRKNGLIRPILNALTNCYGSILPPRGFGDPQRLYKRLVAKALREPKFPSLTTRRSLERLQHRLLMAWDTRFSSAVRGGRYLHGRG